MLFTQDIGIDLGTANTLVFVKGKGIVIREPSVVAVDVRSTPNKVVAVGAEAKEMIGRTPGSITAVRPLKDGVIADFDITADMLKEFIRRAMLNSKFNKARVMICIPSGVTEVERRAVHDAARSAGARQVSLIEEPMAAAIGAGIDVFSPKGAMVLDIGAGTSNMLVTSLGKLVKSTSIKVGGDKFDAAIVRYFKRQHGIVIGLTAAEDLKIRFGSAYPRKEEILMDVKGRSLGGGLPLALQLGSNEITYALSEPLRAIVEELKDALEQTPAELCGDITETGICLTGGSAQLYGLDKFISEQTGVPCYVAEDPASCVAIGAGRVLEDLKTYRNVLYDYRRGDYYEA